MGWDQAEYADLYRADFGSPDRAGTAIAGHGRLRIETGPSILSDPQVKAYSRDATGFGFRHIEGHLNKPDQIETRQAEAGKI